MGIFRNITKSLKKAAPLIGAGIGMYFGGSMGASIGSGIGSLASGRSTEEALMNAALAGGTAYLATGAGTPGAGMKNFSTANSPLRSMFAGADTAVRAPDAIAKASSGTSGSGILSNLIPDSTLGKLTLASTAAGLFGGLGEQKSSPFKETPFAEGQYRAGKLTTLNDAGQSVSFDGGNPEQRLAYYDQLRKNNSAERKPTVANNFNQFGVFSAAIGGEVTGPGTGTSDSVPARLSDGEFVLTAKAMRGAGGGDRDVGAARMDDMMSQLEGAA